MKDSRVSGEFRQKLRLKIGTNNPARCSRSFVEPSVEIDREMSWMGIEPEELDMPQILKLSDELTLLVGFNVKKKEIVIAIGRGGFEDFDMKDYISLPIEAARRAPSFLQDFLMSWDTSLASERIKQILRMEEATSRIGDDPAPNKRRSSVATAQKKFEDHCEICGKKVTTENSKGWFKLYREGTIIWICPDHDTRETFLFSQER